jgi:hypothetical protein
MDSYLSRAKAELHELQRLNDQIGKKVKSEYSPAGLRSLDVCLKNTLTFSVDSPTTLDINKVQSECEQSLKQYRTRLVDNILKAESI